MSEDRVSLENSDSESQQQSGGGAGVSQSQKGSDPGATPLAAAFKSHIRAGGGTGENVMNEWRNEL
jgi:hypothetical protein